MTMTRINITIPQDLARDLRKTIPARKRSQYITSALKEKLNKKRRLQRELVKSLKANYEFDKKIAEEWSVLDEEGWPEWEGKL